ncbi:hypothetical protein GOV11_02105 [Candidatus Woesearchaeota archaeon]|nr:hypothetical protein [Candidatus Woesearchaeota archaeon]
MAVSLGENTPFKHEEGVLRIQDDVIGTVTDIEEDTCDETYYRNNGRALTLNSNIKSDCRGCMFCGAYDSVETEKSLTTEEGLNNKIDELLKESGDEDMSFLDSIGVVTGCFPSEDDVLGHLLLVNDVFKNRGFSGTVCYVGSQITSEDCLVEMGKNNMALYLTVECFERRSNLLRLGKAELNLDDGRDVLKKARNAGLETSFLYILGLDSLVSISEQFPEYLDVISRHPIVNLMQNYQPIHETLRHPTAYSMHYFLGARNLIENVMGKTSMRPRLWENYRAPWATTYGGDILES